VVRGRPVLGSHPFGQVGEVRQLVLHLTTRRVLRSSTHGVSMRQKWSVFEKRCSGPLSENGLDSPPRPRGDTMATTTKATDKTATAKKTTTKAAPKTAGSKSGFT